MTMTVGARWLAAVGVIVMLAALAPSAMADTTIGDVALASHDPAPATLGSPAFQGATSGAYIISSPVTGTISTWRFRTAGADTGSTYALGVLAPVDAAGQTWRLVALTDAHAVTSAGGTDAVMGPFIPATPISIAAGNRIALVPVNTGAVPIEQGVNTVDGIRYFSGPFNGGVGSTQSLASGATDNNGQIVPIQATITGGAPPPNPPVNTTGPSIVGVPGAGRHLTCDPGTWTGSPTYTYAWSETHPVVVGVLGGTQRVHTVQETTQFAIGPTITTPDFRPGVTTITCTVTATNPNGHPSLTSPRKVVQALRPALALCRFIQKGLTCAPQITRGVGFGGTNICTVGRWVHFPALYRFRWVVSDSPKAVGGTIVARAPRIQIGAAEELRYLHCEVQASNRAGRSKWARSNAYYVPQHAPKASGTSHIRILVPDEPASRKKDPSTSQSHPLALDSHYRQEVECSPPQFNRSDATLTYQWEVTFGDQSEEFFGGQLLRVDTYKQPATITTLSQDGTVLLSMADQNFTGKPVKVQCFTDAALSNSDTLVSSPAVWLDTHFAPPGTPNPYPGL